MFYYYEDTIAFSNCFIGLQISKTLTYLNPVFIKDKAFNAFERDEGLSINPNIIMKHFFVLVLDNYW